VNLQRKCSVAVVVFFVACSISIASEINVSTDKIEVGTNAGASWRIDLPESWNRSLIVFYHGSAPNPQKFDSKPITTGLRRIFLSRGFALAESGYSEGGWTIAKAYGDSEWVRKHFTAVHGKPLDTLAIGEAMGGLIVVYALERKNSPYSGGLSLCGSVAAADVSVQNSFGFRAAFDYYFPGILGSLAPVPADFRANIGQVEDLARLLSEKPKAAQALSDVTGVPLQGLAETAISSTEFIKDVEQHSGGGVPVGNMNVIYVGSEDDQDLNAGVTRYSGDSKAEQYLMQNYIPTGKLSRPLLMVHTLHDPIIHIGVMTQYALQVKRAYKSENLAQQYVVADGHCAFKPQQEVNALDEIQRWVRTAKRPTAGRLQ
jgi:hypothetical protein